MKSKSYQTAGGVVVDADGRFLVLERDIERNGAIMHEIRLPKGHIDPGETAQAAAIREVGEESGCWNVRIVADLGSFHSSYVHRECNFERDERYFLMWLTSETPGKPSPQGAEEALFSVSWLQPGESVEKLTYPSEQEFARRALAFVEEDNQDGGDE